MYRAVREDSCSAYTRRVVQWYLLLAASLNLRLIFFFFFRECLESTLLKEEAALIRVCEENGGWEPLTSFLRVLGSSGTSLSPHFAWGGAGTSPRPGSLPSHLALASRRVHAVVASMDRCLHAPSLPPPVCTWSAASRCRFRLFASSGLGEASSLPLPAGITGSPRVYLGLSETLIGMKGICYHRGGECCSSREKMDAFKWLLFCPSVGLHFVQVLSTVCRQWHQFHC